MISEFLETIPNPLEQIFLCVCGKSSQIYILIKHMHVREYVYVFQQSNRLNGWKWKASAPICLTT